jgi:hypothetical protein
MQNSAKKQAEQHWITGEKAIAHACVNEVLSNTS